MNLSMNTRTPTKSFLMKQKLFLARVGDAARCQRHQPPEASYGEHHPVLLQKQVELNYVALVVFELGDVENVCIPRRNEMPSYVNEEGERPAQQRSPRGTLGQGQLSRPSKVGKRLQECECERACSQERYGLLVYQSDGNSQSERSLALVGCNCIKSEGKQCKPEGLRKRADGVNQQFCRQRSKERCRDARNVSEQLAREQEESYRQEHCEKHYQKPYCKVHVSCNECGRREQKLVSRHVRRGNPPAVGIIVLNRVFAVGENVLGEGNVEIGIPESRVVKLFPDHRVRVYACGYCYKQQGVNPALIPVQINHFFTSLLCKSCARCRKLFRNTANCRKSRSSLPSMRSRGTAPCPAPKRIRRCTSRQCARLARLNWLRKNRIACRAFSAPRWALSPNRLLQCLRAARSSKALRRKCRSQRWCVRQCWL